MGTVPLVGVSGACHLQRPTFSELNFCVEVYLLDAIFVGVNMLIT
jgi:hypothetical protein